ncbi:hypothetical protein D3C84_901600 [compost metagenome]
MGDEADHRGARQNARVAQGGDGRYGDVFRHDLLFANGGVQHRYDVRTPRPDQRVPDQRGLPGGRQRGQQQPGCSRQAAQHNHPFGPHFMHDGIAGQAPCGHGQGKGGIPQAGIGAVDMALGGQEHRTPVQHRAFGEKHDEAQAADKQHHAVGHGKRRPRAVAAIGQPVGRSLEQ